MKNLLATLCLSQGVPMLVAGDEMARTQGGNNNAYCQDNEISWIDWQALEREPGQTLYGFLRGLLQLRQQHQVFHRSRFFVGRTIPGTDVRDVTWLRPDGEPMTEKDWQVGHARTLGMLLSGEAGEMHLTERGEPEPDDTFLLIMNAGADEIDFHVPKAHWWCVFDTTVTGDAAEALPDEDTDLGEIDRFEVGGRALVLLRRNGGGE